MIQPYAVTCDDCQVTIKLTHSLRESMEGGRCQACEVEYQLQNWASRQREARLRAAKKEAP